MTASDLRISHLEPTRDGGWVIGIACADRTAFLATVSELKRRISYHDREYDPKTRTWWLASDKDLLRLDHIFPDLAAQMAAARAGAWKAPPRPAPTPRMPVAVAEAFTALHLLPNAPRAVAQAAYRTLAHAAHPDHGGSHDAMLALNLSYEAVCAWLDRLDQQEPPSTGARRRGTKEGAA